GWSQGTGSAAFLEGEAWGEMDGAMVVGIMGIAFGGTPVGQRIEVLHLSDDGTELLHAATMDLPMEPARFRSVVMGPDGSLYVAVDEGMIHKITP
ncbi:MAG: PQQ-dependent sugar dehydrogenase, partial [Pseudomonadota bacterium]